MTVARCRWRLRTLSEWPSVRHKIIASTEASSIPRATSGLARMSGAVFARWPAVSCSFRNRDRAAIGGVRLRAKLAGTNSRPIIALLAAARSSGIKDTEPHRQGAKDRRYHSQSSPFLEIWPSAISTPLISIDGSPGSDGETIPSHTPKVPFPIQPVSRNLAVRYFDAVDQHRRLARVGRKNDPCPHPTGRYFH